MTTTANHEPTAAQRQPPGGDAAVAPTHGSSPAPRQSMPWRADLVIALMFAGWLLAAAFTARSLSPRDALHLVPIVAVTALMGRLKLGIYASNTQVSLGAVGDLAAGMLFGVPGAVACSTIAFVLGWNSHYTPRRVLFNLGASSLSAGAAIIVFGAVRAVIPAWSDVLQVPGALAAGAIAYSGQSLLVAVMVSLSQRRTLREVWEERFGWLLPHALGLGLIALGVALSYRAIGVTALLAFTGPALLMRYAMKQYLDRTARSVEELRARNEALQAANTEIAAMSDRLQETYAGTLEALVSALDARDQETHGHSSRVAQFTAMLAKHMGVPEGSPEWFTIERGALLHDVGKIGVPDAILRKPGKLTEEEWIEMRRHPQIGFEMLRDIPFLAGAAEIVAAHHERWDGKGYPRGLAGEQIPLGARIFAVADTFDAMATDRPYRRARPYPECLAEITRCSGTQFDPAVVEALHAIYPRWIELHQQCLRKEAERLSVVA